MKTINEHIKTEQFENVYLLFGEEEYLKKQCRDRLKTSIIADDTMNYSYFEGERLDVKQIISICNTLPFFCSRRLVIIENSGFLKSSNEELADYIKSLPEYLVMIFVEKEVDKRNKVYKAINANGYVCELKPQSTAVLQRWIIGILSKENLKITKDACDLLLSKTGAGMELITHELEKLISYCKDREGITADDVQAVCSTHTVSHIFDMIEAIANKKQAAALNLYYDLLTLKEPPMRILYLIVRQFNGILQAKELLASGLSSKEVASAMGIAPFIAVKYMKQADFFTKEQIRDALKNCAETEECVKQGRLNDRLAVELIIIRYSG